MSVPDRHVPVLGRRVAELARGARRIVDGTVGDGGHSEQFLAQGADLLAIDRDPAAIERARERLGEERITWRHGRFGDPAVLADVERFRPEFVLLDLGVSSRQLDDDALGFSFRRGVPLDMRMDRTGRSAAELLNRLPQAELARIFHDFADERRARPLAREIVERRGRAPFALSDDFVNAIRAALGRTAGPAAFARLFQALRMVVNDERGELRRALPALREALPPAGRIAVISYHSGEDRIVKRTFREWARACVCPPKQPVCTCRGAPLGRLDPRKPIRPDETEVRDNPRARSATLRAFQIDGGS